MRFTLLVAALIAGAPGSAIAQSLTGTPLAPSPYPDARLVPRGVLRVSFEPEYVTYDHVFDEAGNPIRLGARMSSDAAGSDLFGVVVSDTEQRVRDFTGLADYRLSIGRLTAERDADIRRFPFNFEFGLTNALSLTASLPIVTTRGQVSLTLDSTGANAGLNLESTTTDVRNVANSFESQADFVDAQIAGGNYGCPTSAMCDQARAAVARTRMLVSDLRALVSGVADQLPPFLPLASSTAGQAINQVVADVAAELAPFAAEPTSTALPLPGQPLDSAALRELLPGTVDFVKYRQKLGDIELGFRWGAVQSDALRAVVAGTVRLPTGMRDDPSHLVDIGTGDRQTDVIGGIDAVWTPGAVLALAVTAAYTVQFADRLPYRMTDPAEPFSLLASTATVSRDLGDVLRLSGYPSLRLSDAFTAYGSVHYFRKEADQLNGATSAYTSIESLSFGAGVHYSPYGLEGQMPIQAGIDYRAAFRGKGGFAPKDVRLNFYLRLYYRLFGGAASRE